MDSPSHIAGEDGGEGCSSCESGWTMYLASSTHVHGHHGAGGSGSSQGSSVDDGYGYMVSRGKKQGYEAYADAEDDSSLASDASTGPAKVKSTLPQHQHGKDDDDGGHRGEEERADKAGGGEGNSSRRGHSKSEGGGGSSRRSFFLW